MLIATVVIEPNRHKDWGRGDIVSLRLGSTCRAMLEACAKHPRQFQLAEWRDDAVELELLAKRDAGEPHPVKPYPYKETSKGEMTRRSYKRVKLEDLPEPRKETIYDIAQMAPILSNLEYAVEDKRSMLKRATDALRITTP